MLVGRERDCAGLNELLQQARVGSSGICVVRGEPGIGKTAMLDYAESKASDFTMLRGRGLPAEADLSFAVLYDVLTPLLPGVANLLPRQRAVLEGALGLGPPAGSEAFAVAASVLALLAKTAEERPLLINIDDCQWVDRSSLNCLAFVGRRLAADRTLMIFAEREMLALPGGLPVLSDFPRMQLGRLPSAAAEELLRWHGPNLGYARAKEVLSTAGGHPLALIELAKTRSRERSPVQPAGLGSQLESGFRDELDTLDHRARLAVDALAILGETSAEPLIEALHRLGLSLDDLATVEELGLVQWAHGVLGFRHPLIQGAAYSAIPPNRRRKLHLAAAAALGSSGLHADVERRAWHRSAGTIGPDESLAQELENLARAAIERSSAASAVRLLERAADHSASGAARARRLLAAAEYVQTAGLMDVADELLERAAAANPVQDVAVQVGHLRCRFDMWRGMPVQGRDALLDLARLVSISAPAEAAVMYGHAALTSAWLGEITIGQAAIERAIELIPPDSEPVLPVLAAGSLLDLVSGNPTRGRERLDLCLRGIDKVGQLSAEQLPLVVALCRFADDDVDGARRSVEQTVRSARAASAAGLLPFQLSRLAIMQFAAGQWSAALASADEAVRVANDTGWTTELPAALTALARVEAGLGRIEDCRAHARTASDSARGAGVHIISAQARAALGLLELGLGQPAAAAAHFEQVAAFAADQGLVDNPLLCWLSDLCESYIRLGDAKEAGRVLVALETEVERSGRSRLVPAFERCKGLLAASEREAERLFEHSVWTAEQIGAPFEQARSSLCLGQLYRRQRRIGEARRALMDALVIFEQLGPGPWAEKAIGELHASGVQVDHRAPNLFQLTPQEMSVASSAAEGLTNQQIATKLFLSVRTVEFHLTNVYRKLNVNRRSQLVSVLRPRAVA